MTGTKGRAARLLGIAAVLGTLLWSPSEVQAAGSNVGGGAFEGTVNFSAGVPATGCRTTSFSLNGTVAGVVLNTVLTGHAGTATIWGGGGSTTCESASTGIGTLSIGVNGVGPTGSRLTCGSLSGGYIRVGPEVVVSLNGSCTVNNFPAGDVLFLASSAFVPTNVGGGVTTDVTTAAFAGTFVVVPRPA